MYLVSEENHGALCVTDSVIHGLAWLVRNNWLTLGCEMVDENGECYTLAERIGGNPKPSDTFTWFAKILCKDGSRMTFEILEEYGFYFEPIEEAY